MVKFFACITAMFILLMATAIGYAADTSIINEYDANGNLVTGDGRYYEYNDANQLARVRQGDQAGPVIAEYVYDAAGQRVKKIENGVVTYYVGRHYEKQVGGTNAGGTSYYFGEGGERVAKKDPAGNIFYYHLDHLDGINVVTNSTGTEVSRTDYLPFGDLRTGSSDSEKYSYTGKEKDKTSLYYFEARYNSPEFRHFTQADIAEPDYADPQDLNRYAYVGNNPLSYVDYDGFKKKKKKAKLSKREKWMIAHGADPDHDKTSLKKAKKLFKEGKKYTIVAKSATSSARSATYNWGGVGTEGNNYDLAFIDQGKAWNDHINFKGPYFNQGKATRDWCGTKGFDVPDVDGHLIMGPACEIHDRDFERLGSNYLASNINLGLNIYKINPDDRLGGFKKGMKYFLGVETPIGLYAYIKSQFEAGEREKKGKLEVLKIIWHANVW